MDVEYSIQMIGWMQMDPSEVLDIRTVMIQIMALVVDMLVMVMVVAMTTVIMVVDITVVVGRKMMPDRGVMFSFRFRGGIRIFLRE